MADDIFIEEDDVWRSGTVNYITMTAVQDEIAKEIGAIPLGTVIIQSPTEPISPQEGDLWIDTSG